MKQPGRLAVIIPSATDAFVARALASLELNAGVTLRRLRDQFCIRVIVADSGLTRSFWDAWSDDGVLDRVGVPGGVNFSFPAAVNAAASRVIEWGRPDALLLLNDDVVLNDDGSCGVVGLMPLIASMRAARVGLTALAVEEGLVGNPGQQSNGRADRQALRPLKGTLCMLAALIDWTCWESLGGLDERFGGPGTYGWEDADFTLRARGAGWGAGVTETVRVRHGVRGASASSTFARVYGAGAMPALLAEGRRRFEAKWRDLAQEK